MVSLHERIIRLSSRTIQRAMLRGKYVKPAQHIVKLMLDDQVGRCAICEIEFSDTVKYVVDHCHSTNKVRGLLCYPCNVALGMFKDQPTILERAINYLNGDVKFRA